MIIPNDSRTKPNLENLFDSDTGVPVKTENINPYILSFTFKEPISLKTVRIFPSYSSYDWVVYTGSSEKEKGLMIRNAPEEDWSRLDLPKAVSTKTVRLEILRTVRDNFVHVNEIEFYTE